MHADFNTYIVMFIETYETHWRFFSIIWKNESNASFISTPNFLCMINCAEMLYYALALVKNADLQICHEGLSPSRQILTQILVLTQ